MTSANIINNSLRKVEDYEALKIRMTLETTNMIAASIIVEKDFPKATTLPKFVPLPFNNFGHFFLFDYSRLLYIIYQTIDGFKKLAKKKNKYLSWWWAAGTLLAVVLLVYISGLGPGLYLFSLAAALIAYMASESRVESKLNIEFADYKATVIEQLLNNKWEENTNLQITNRLKQSLQACTNGMLPENETAVLIMFDELSDGDDNEQPFPGFGRLQLDEKFVCPPKKVDEKIKIDEMNLFENVINKLGTSLPCCGISSLGFRKVIIINSDSISIDSPWLDENKVPFLTKEIDFNSTYLLDKNVSIRMYFLVEVLFPKYDSAACFFIRPFKAENAAGCHIALSTIGPPVIRQENIRRKLMKYRRDKENSNLQSGINTSSDFNDSENMLTKIQANSNVKEKFHENISSSAIEDLDPMGEKKFNKVRFEKKSKEIIEKEISWPGSYYCYKYNIREKKSLTFGGDFFGRPELISSITTIYDQISRTMLESIEDQGFDISKYKDKEGKFTVNAGSIEKIIMGEVINMKSDSNNSTDDGKKNDDNKKTA